MSLRERAEAALAEREAEVEEMERSRIVDAWEAHEAKVQRWAEKAVALFGEEPHVEYWLGWWGHAREGELAHPDTYGTVFVFGEGKDAVYLHPYGAQCALEYVTKFKLTWPCPLCNAILVAEYQEVASLADLGKQLGQLARGELRAYDHECEYAKKPTYASEPVPPTVTLAMDSPEWTAVEAIRGMIRSLAWKEDDK